MLNMFTRSAVILIVAVFCFAPGCSRPDQAAKLAAALQGEWGVTTLERAGKSASAAVLADATVRVDGDQFTLSEPKGAKKKVGQGVMQEFNTEAYRIQLDPAKADKEIDLAYAEGDRAGQVRRAIYSLEGDTLKICIAPANEARPSQFEAGKQNMLLILTRRAVESQKK